jgi:hypothetical protein
VLLNHTGNQLAHALYLAADLAHVITPTRLGIANCAGRRLDIVQCRSDTLPLALSRCGKRGGLSLELIERRLRGIVLGGKLGRGLLEGGR